MGTFEQSFKRIKVKDRLALGEGFSVQRKQIPHDLAEHEAVQRFSHVEKFLQRPQLNAAFLGSSGSINANFEVEGTNMTSDLATFSTAGGVTLTTAGADGDVANLQVHQDSNVSALNSLAWDPAKKLRFATTLSFGSISFMDAILVGFKLTSGSDPATDDDQAMFYVANGTTASGSIQCVYSIAGTDVYAGSATNARMQAGFAVNTNYDLLIEVDASRVPRFYLDGDLVATGTAMTAAAALKPFIKIESGTAEARDVKVRYLALSRDI